jgi:hypothetical protein
MLMRIIFIGAAEEVTRSCLLVVGDGMRFLVGCGCREYSSVRLAGVDQHQSVSSSCATVTPWIDSSAARRRSAPAAPTCL